MNTGTWFQKFVVADILRERSSYGYLHTDSLLREGMFRSSAPSSKGRLGQGRKERGKEQVRCGLAAAWRPGDGNLIKRILVPAFPPELGKAAHLAGGSLLPSGPARGQQWARRPQAARPTEPTPLLCWWMATGDVCLGGKWGHPASGKPTHRNTGWLRDIPEVWWLRSRTSEDSAQ